MDHEEFKGNIILIAYFLSMVGIASILFLFWHIANGISKTEHRVIVCKSSNMYLSVEDAVKFQDGIVYRVKGDKIRVIQPATGCSINTIEVEK